MGPSALLPSVPNLEDLKCQTPLCSLRASPYGTDVVFRVLFQSLCSISPASLEALQFMHHSHHVPHDFFLFILYLHPVHFTNRHWLQHTLIFRRKSITFSPIESCLQPSYPMIVDDCN